MIKKSSLGVYVIVLFFLIGWFWGPKASAEALIQPAGAEQLAATESLKQPASAETLKQPASAETLKQPAGVESQENPVVAETIKFENPEVKLDANQIIMDSDLNLIKARGKVRLLVKQSNLRFETEELDYDLREQVVKIPGQVRFSSETGDFQVNTLTYSVKTLEGQGGAFKGNLAASSRAVTVEGNQFETMDAGKKISISGATLTRCPKPRSDYLFKSSKITITKERISLSHILLYFKGIPIFYLPYFSFTPRENSKFPKIESGLRYDPKQGSALDYEVSAPINDQSDFLVKGSVSQGDDSNLGVGYGFQVGALKNKSYLIKYFEQDWMIEDVLEFPLGGAIMAVDASHELGGDGNKVNVQLTKDFGTILLNADSLYNSIGNEQQRGFNLTRKYWKGWLGNWQLGVQARQVSKEGVGGVFGGYQLDYQPNPYLTLSYLRLDSFTDPLTYGDFDPNLGSSALYQVKVPLTNSFSFSQGGTYNLNDSEWKSLSYGFTYDTCCYAVAFQWDTIADSKRSINLLFKF